MPPKIEFRDRSSGQRGSNSDVLEGPKLSCAWEDRRRSLERFFESHFWFMFSQSKLKQLPSRFQHRHLDWGLAEKHRYFHFITIPFDSIQFRVLSKVQPWSETPLITTAKQSSDQSPCLALSSQEFRMLTQTEWFERWSHEIPMKWFCLWNTEVQRWIQDDKQTLFGSKHPPLLSQFWNSTLHLGLVYDLCHIICWCRPFESSIFSFQKKKQKNRFELQLHPIRKISRIFTVWEWLMDINTDLVSKID